MRNSTSEEKERNTVWEEKEVHYDVLWWSKVAKMAEIFHSLAPQWSDKPKELTIGLGFPPEVCWLSRRKLETSLPRMWRNLRCLMTF